MSIAAYSRGSRLVAREADERMPSERGTRFHPTQKPVALLLWCLSLLPDAEAVVLDPYAGAGPTLIAAKQLGRHAIGIEIEERYCEIAAKRLGQEVLFGVQP